MPTTPVNLDPERLRGVRLLALDVDGVLTDGRVVYLGDEELMRFDVKDGQALRWLIEAGVHVTWISGRGCAATERRARELGVQEVHLRTRDKAAKLEEVQKRVGCGVEATCAMGDDLPDFGLAARAAVFIAPRDAVELVRHRADAVTLAGGGRGAVRELAEALLGASGRWKDLARGYLEQARGAASG